MHRMTSHTIGNMQGSRLDICICIYYKIHWTRKWVSEVYLHTIRGSKTSGEVPLQISKNNVSTPLEALKNVLTILVSTLEGSETIYAPS
mgnify:CR=1 FL=1